MCFCCSSTTKINSIRNWWWKCTHLNLLTGIVYLLNYYHCYNSFWHTFGMNVTFFTLFLSSANLCEMYQMKIKKRNNFSLRTLCDFSIKNDNNIDWSNKKKNQQKSVLIVMSKFLLYVRFEWQLYTDCGISIRNHMIYMAHTNTYTLVRIRIRCVRMRKETARWLRLSIALVVVLCGARFDSRIFFRLLTVFSSFNFWFILKM